MKKILVAVVAALALTACLSGGGIPLAPGAEKVSLTRNPTDVTNCKVLGPVSGSKDAYAFNVKGSTKEKEMTKSIQNIAFSLGADTVFITDAAGAYIGPRNGIAYNCSGVELRQPVPVQPK
jgi:hypothetical protein